MRNISGSFQFYPKYRREKQMEQKRKSIKMSYTFVYTQILSELSEKCGMNAKYCVNMHIRMTPKKILNL